MQPAFFGALICVPAVGSHTRVTLVRWWGCCVRGPSQARFGMPGAFACRVLFREADGGMDCGGLPAGGILVAVV